MTIKQFSEMVPEVGSDKNKVYKAYEIVFIAFVAVLCGSDTLYEIEMFGNTNIQYFKNRLPGLERIPSHDTFNKFFAAIDIEWFEECFRTWVNALCTRVPGVVAIDGKAVCPSPDNASNSCRSMKSRLYMVSAWAVANGICLGQRVVEGKSNEITAIPELLKMLDITNCIVTIDAIGCQKKITDLIIKAGADYILCIKNNQKELRRLAEFNLGDRMREELCKGKRYFEENTGHGRKEYRECVCVDVDSRLVPFYYQGWKGIKTLAMIKSTRTEGNGHTVSETRYYISSLEADPVLILKSVRSHWEVENNLHWVLDVAFREDYTRKTGNAAVNFSTMSKMALILLKQCRLKVGIASKRKACGWDEKLRDQIIGIEQVGNNLTNGFLV